MVWRLHPGLAAVHRHGESGKVVRHLQRIAIALAALFLGGFAAMAAPALVTADANVRRGPGRNFPVVAVIPGGSTVEVISCRGGWCSVRFAALAGFVNAAFLDLGGPPRGYYVPPTAPLAYGQPPPYGGPRWRWYGWGW